MTSSSVGAAANVQDSPLARDVLAELERILQSPHFEASERRRAFLRHIVEKTLSGQTDRLKGYTIAIAIFGRDESFDAQSDPVVRLEARRLRRDLDSYYVDSGSLDPIRISIPKGSYVAYFEKRELSEPVTIPGPDTSSDSVRATTRGEVPGVAAAVYRLRRTSPGRLLFGAIIVGVVIVAVGLSVLNGNAPSAKSDAEGGPVIVVMPFKALGSTENSEFLAAGISQDLISDLMRFPGFRLYTLPMNFPETAGHGAEQSGAELGPAYVINGSVRDDANVIRVAVQLIRAATGEVLWTEAYDQPPNPQALIETQHDLAGKIASAIGSPYGAVNVDLESRPETSAVNNLQSYICVLRAYRYRRNFSVQEFGPVLNCLEEAVQSDPNYADAWAMLGWLHLDAGRYEFAGKDALQEQYQKGFDAASRAVSLQPDNPLAIKALASIDHYMGRFDEAERLSRQALALNPYDPDTLAQLGWRLAVRGNLEEGIPLLEKAIERTANPPGWYFHLVAIDYYLKGEYPQMLEVAKRSVVEGTPVSYALLAIASGELEDADGTRAALEQMSGFDPIMRDPGAYFRRHGTTDEITDALVAGLEQARRVAGDTSE